MSPEGKVRVLVRSKRVPVRIVTISRPTVSVGGLMVGTQTTRAFVYDTSYDDQYRRAIHAAKKLSCNLDLDFEIVDRSRSNPIRRLISALAGGHSGSPSLTVEPLSTV
jgi:hypothetical protein